MPIYVRAGAIIPVDPVRQYTAQPVTEPTTLKVYRGADGQFTLYDDDGISQEYLKGRGSWTRIVVERPRPAAHARAGRAARRDERRDRRARSRCSSCRRARPRTSPTAASACNYVSSEPPEAFEACKARNACEASIERLRLH